MDICIQLSCSRTMHGARHKFTAARKRFTGVVFIGKDSVIRFKLRLTFDNVMKHR